jgi:hypothetical protein
VEAAEFVALVERFADERDLSVWERIVAALDQLDRLVEGDADQALHTRVAALVGPVRAALGAEAEPGEDDRTRTLRGLLLQAAALLADDGAARERSADLLDRFLEHPPSVDPSLASPALVVSATLGDRALHDRLADRFRAADNPQDRERLLLALSRFRDPDCLARTLELSLSGDVRTQDAPYLLRETLANRDNGPTAWAFVAANWPEIERRFPANSLSRLVGGVRQVRDAALAREVAAFLAEHPIPQGELQVRQHVERMGVNVALAERESPRLSAALTGA